MKDIFQGLELPDEIKTTLTERIESEVTKKVEGAQNDPDFISQIRNEVSGKFFATAEKMVKRNLQVKAEDIDQDLSGLKKLEALLKMGISGLEKNKDTTNQDLQTQLLAVNDEMRVLVEETHPAAMEAEKQSHYGRYVREAIQKDTLGIDTTCTEKARVSIVRAFLQDKGLEDVWDNDEQVYVIQTKKEKLKYTVDGKALSNKEIVQLALDDGGVLVKSNGKPKPGDQDYVAPKPGDGKKHEMTANAQAMKDSFPIPA